MGCRHGTATRRADAAESLSACEQVFRVLLDQDYPKARRILDLHRDLLYDEQSAEERTSGNGKLSPSLAAQSEQNQAGIVEDESGLPELPI